MHTLTTLTILLTLAVSLATPTANTTTRIDWNCSACPNITLAPICYTVKGGPFDTALIPNP